MGCTEVVQENVKLKARIRHLEGAMQRVIAAKPTVSTPEHTLAIVMLRKALEVKHG